MEFGLKMKIPKKSFGIWRSRRFYPTYQISHNSDSVVVTWPFMSLVIVHRIQVGLGYTFYIKRWSNCSLCYLIRCAAWMITWVECFSPYNDSYSFFFFFLLFLVKIEWNGFIGHQNNEGQKEDDLELPFLDLSTIANATNNFAINNKPGEGGFGPVYKVILWCACTKTMQMMKHFFILL